MEKIGVFLLGINREILVSFCALLVLLALIGGCSRDNANSSSKLSLQLVPQKAVGTLSNHTVDFISVNVSGPGMERVLWTWDAHDFCPGDCQVAPLPPELIFLDVPSGSDRLIQVLIVADDEVADTMDFQYGDVVKSLGAGFQEVPVTLNSNVIAAGQEGSVHGRYFLPDGSTYTGDVALKFSPLDRPPMELFHLEMFAGWFTIYAFQNFKLRYTLTEIDHTMFETDIDLNSSLFTTGPSVLKVTPPNKWEDYNQDGTLDDFEAAEVSIVGFWQGGVAMATGHAVCYDTTSMEYQGQFSEDTLNTLVAYPSDFTMDPSTNTCSVTDPAVTATQISMDGKLLENSGGDRMVFQGPFMNFYDATNDFSDLLHTSYNTGSNTLSLQWKFMPEVLTGSRPVTGVGVFYSTGASSGGGGGGGGGPGGMECLDLLNEGFQLIETAGGTESVTIPNIDNVMINSTKVVICPKLADAYFAATSIESHCLGSSCGGGSNGDSLSETFTDVGQTNEEMGKSVLVADFVGDGTLDYLVGLPGAGGGDGEVRIYDGSDPTAAPLVCVPPSNTGKGFGASLAVGDLDNTGGNELVVGSNLNEVRIFATNSCTEISGSPIAHGSGINYGASVAIADIDGDTTEKEIIVGDHGRNSGDGSVGTIYWSGSTWTVGVSFAAVQPGGNCGATVAAGNGLDIGGDSMQDVLVGCPGTGSVEVFYGVLSGGFTPSSADLTISNGNIEFGKSILIPTDLDTDGKIDFIVGSPGENSGTGKVYAFKGTSALTSLWTVLGSGLGDNFGASLTNFPDVDSADGVDDIAIGAPGVNGDKGEIKIVSGANGGSLMTIPGVNSASRFGDAISHTPGLGEILIGAPTTGTMQGRIHVMYLYP